MVRNILTLCGVVSFISALGVDEFAEKADQFRVWGETVENTGMKIKHEAETTMKDLERQAILDALEQPQGNRTHAAAALGIGRRTLQNKLRQFGLASDQAED